MSQMMGWPPFFGVIKNLVIINALFFLSQITAQQVFQTDLAYWLGLHHWGSEAFQPVQVVTSMFLHSSINIMHIIFNMFALWMFGSKLEMQWGAKKMLVFYLFCGIGANLLYNLVGYIEMIPFVEVVDTFLRQPTADHLSLLTSKYSHYMSSEGYTYLSKIANNGDVEAIDKVREVVQRFKIGVLNDRILIGASGAVYGVFLAYGYYYFHETIHLYFLFPIKAGYLVFALTAFAIWSSFQHNPADNVAHLAHLGGMIFALGLIKYWEWKGE
ncbi:MAG: rhomboid family intramembrane serine protease [Chitinophagales bacterium]